MMRQMVFQNNEKGLLENWEPPFNELLRAFGHLP